MLLLTESKRRPRRRESKYSKKPLSVFDLWWKFGASAQRFGEALDSFERATDYMLKAVGAAPQEALAGATAYLRMFGLAFGGVGLVRTALAAHKAGDGDAANSARVGVMRFFAEQVIPAMPGLETTVTQGAGAVLSAADAAIGA